LRRKLAILRQHCREIGRPYESVLRMHLTGWIVRAENEARLKAKLQRYFPQGVQRRFSGPWHGFVFVGTPAQAIAYYQELVAADFQYFIVQTLDPADEETIRLLAEAVVPVVSS
jgi:hypothetical protein